MTVNNVRGIFNKQVSLLRNFCVNEAFYSSAGGSTSSRSSVQQMAQESASCHAWDKLMCNGNDNCTARKYREVHRSLWMTHITPNEIHGKLMKDVHIR